MPPRSPQTDLILTLVPLIEAAIAERKQRRAGREIAFLCPAHDDRSPSAYWNPEKHVWFCHVCGTGGGAIALAGHLGLSLPYMEGNGLTLEALADAKGLPVEALRGFSVGEDWDGRGSLKRPCVTIPYRDEKGQLMAVRRRLRLDGADRFIWRRGDKVMPYGLGHLAEARTVGGILIVEGESDCWTAWQARIPALGIPGASTWKPAWAEYLHGMAEIYVWHEPDAGGDDLVPKVAASFPEARIIDAPPGIKDLNALWLSVRGDLDAFKARLADLKRSARPVSQLNNEALSAKARDALAKAQFLLDDPNLVDRIGEAIRDGGYAGDLKPPQLTYFALTSRLLPRPLNLNVVAPPASGKNRTVDSALSLMPHSAYYLIKAGSARSFIYADEDFQHRTVVYAEADSIPDEGPAASAIRALAEDNEMTYDVTTQDPKTNAFRTVRISKPGPTGLITTSTRPLGEQLGTRLLETSVSDTPGQTRAVLRAQGAAASGDEPSFDPTPWIALQEWLAFAGKRRVIVPFALALAESVPVGQVRMRRDFPKLLTVIMTVALLRQRQREVDSQGRIVATLDDYRTAKDVLEDVFNAAASGGVSATVRQTVDAVGSLYDGSNAVTIKSVGDHLGLAKNSALYRVRSAIGKGFLTNLEDRRGRPARLIPGDPLPEDRQALPDPAELELGDVCVALPESLRTVEPDVDGEEDAESELAVQSVVLEQLEPPVEPVDEILTDTNRRPVDQAVLRFMSDRPESTRARSQSSLRLSRCEVCGHDLSIINDSGRCGRCALLPG